MFVAIDDTDSINGNCTTFLATEIIKEFQDLDLIGNPRLVRLNPAVPWKTRGNGSLIMQFGKGIGIKKLIGNIDGDIFCYESFFNDPLSENEFIDRIAPLIERYHEDDSNPGMVVSKIRPNPTFYQKGVKTIVDRGIIEAEIKRIHAKKFEIGNGRGIVGSLCGMAWIPNDFTLELLTYRKRENWGTERIYDKESIKNVELHIRSTFNSYDVNHDQVAMIPSTPCPVMYGLRGDDDQDLLKGLKSIKCEELDRWMLFLTNQGTDDHIIYDSTNLIPNQSYCFEGVVKSPAIREKGGHTFIEVMCGDSVVTCAAYEPSKDFRSVLDGLSKGDVIEVMGELRENPRTLNIEKINVLKLVDVFEKYSNPICGLCGKRMKSTGFQKGYRCRDCDTTSNSPLERKVERKIHEGWYEPPVFARRHLSKPLKRMNKGSIDE